MCHVKAAGFIVPETLLNAHPRTIFTQTVAAGQLVRHDSKQLGGMFLVAMSVEGASQGGAQIGRASVAVTDQTRLFEQEGQTRRSITFEALKTGQRMQIRFLGPVAETYPVQATADEIVVLK